jgi:Protein of unknown function (DUF3175)
MNPQEQKRKTGGNPRRWVRTVNTSSTFPPEGLFTKEAHTIARILASKRVSPKGVTSGLRMLLFFINRAGRQLTSERRSELQKAKRLLQEMIAKRRKRNG